MKWSRWRSALLKHIGAALPPIFRISFSSQCCVVEWVRYKRGNVVVLRWLVIMGTWEMV
jgi:hypothetical protein